MSNSSDFINITCPSLCPCPLPHDPRFEYILIGLLAIFTIVSSVMQCLAYYRPRDKVYEVCAHYQSVQKKKKKKPLPEKSVQFSIDNKEDEEFNPEFNTEIQLSTHSPSDSSKNHKKHESKTTSSDEEVEFQLSE